VRYCKTAVRKLVAVPAALLVGVVAGAAAPATKTIADVPKYKFFVSSHSTAAAEVLAYRGVKRGLPEVVLIGGLEGRIYRCDCGKDINLWDVAEGTRLWAAAEGLKVKTEARVLRASTGPASASGSSAGAGLPATSSTVTPGSPSADAPSGIAGPPSTNSPAAAPLDFDYYRQSIDAGRPVIMTYSLDEASAKGMEASFESQQRVSVVGIGYDETGEDSAAQSPATAGGGGATYTTAGGPSTLLRMNRCATHGESDPDGYVIVSLPEDAEKEKRFEQLMSLPGVKAGEQEGLLLIPWDVQTGNLMATFVEAPE